jgi:hypothetical protein
LMKFLRVVDVMRMGSMKGVRAECNRQEIKRPGYRLLIVFDYLASSALESGSWEI